MPLALVEPHDRDRLRRRHIIARREIRLLEIPRTAPHRFRRRDDKIASAHVMTVLNKHHARADGAMQMLWECDADERSRTYPKRPFLAVSAAILRDGKVLIVRRARTRRLKGSTRCRAAWSRPAKPCRSGQARGDWRKPRSRSSRSHWPDIARSSARDADGQGGAAFRDDAASLPLGERRAGAQRGTRPRRAGWTRASVAGLSTTEGWPRSWPPPSSSSAGEVAAATFRRACFRGPAPDHAARVRGRRPCRVAYAARLLERCLVIAPRRSPLAPARARRQRAAFEADLQRLAEILGALHYLRGVCGANDGQKWRNEMQALVDSEAQAAGRRAS